ncbi:RNA polymerase sigma factor [Methyloprofundus sp.]|uniref:RNA polymerase sigma factor n=1 Tax=Methyloprofundus sp. TaxID=2020875 RepID=UPI003D109715
MIISFHLPYHRSNNRRQARHADETELFALADPSPAPDHQVYTQEQLVFLKQAIAELPPKCRQVFILHKFRSYPYSIIMQELNIAESTVLKHMVKAMQHCRRRMAELDPE